MTGPSRGVDTCGAGPLFSTATRHPSLCWGGVLLRLWRGPLSTYPHDCYYYYL